MRINHLELSKELIADSGIASLKMERLGSVVALVGRNGSGKSRVLKLVENYVKNLNSKNFQNGDVLKFPNQINELLKEIDIDDLKKNMKAIRDKLRSELLLIPNNTDIRKRYNAIKTELANLENPGFVSLKMQNLQNRISLIASSYLVKITNAEIRNLKEVIDASVDDSEITFEKLIESITENDKDELGAIYSTGLSYLSALPPELIESQIENFNDREKFEKSKPYKRFSALAKFIKLFLNKELTYGQRKIDRKKNSTVISIDVEGLWKLDGREFNYKELSDGEKVLFSYSLLFFLLDQNKKLKIQESIILIDEPELHLHPEAEFDVIEGIRRVISEKGQLWIATHSISILSSLAYDEIFMLKKGVVISPKRTTPGESFIELMGLEKHIDKLSFFVSNISNWAYLNFMIQCFSDPDVIKNARKNDPEFLLFKKKVSEAQNSSILLDFGAGQGRVYREIIKDETVKKKLQYFALEPDEKNIDELRGLNLQTYASHKDLPEGFFDFILMCNVLHEINIKEWELTLNNIKKSLKSGGCLIIIEDLRMPKGERVGEHGFLIMDAKSLQELFSLKTEPVQIYSDDKNYKDRLNCSVIIKESIGMVNKASVMNSLKILMKNTILKIKATRELTVTSENQLSIGRESAFYSQLYINSLLSYEFLEQDSSPFVKEEKEAFFKNGETAWKTFLEQELDPDIPAKKGAPPGKYTVWIQFVIDVFGNVGQPKPLSSYGYGMEDEAIRAILKSPKWIPAIQNGRKVKAYRKQSITFEVSKR